MQTFDLTLRLGLVGRTVCAAEWREGSIFVLLNGVPEQIELASSARRRAAFPLTVRARVRWGVTSYQYRTCLLLVASSTPIQWHTCAASCGMATSIWRDSSCASAAILGREDVPLSEAFERYVVPVQNGVQCVQLAVNDPRWIYGRTTN
jgi:hypothetical protein